MKLWIKMVIGLALGIILGFYIQPDSVFLEPLRVVGMLFFKLLSFLVLPLILFSGVRSIINLKLSKRLLVVFSKSIGYFLLFSAIGAAIGVVLGDVLEPGVGINIKSLESTAVLKYPETSDYILMIIPDSIFSFVKSGYRVLPIIFIAYLVAIAIILTKNKSNEFHSLVDSIDNTLHKINIMILEFLPIGIFAYIGYMMGYFTVDKIIPYLKLIMVVVVASFVQIFFIQSLFIFFLTKKNPFKFIYSLLSTEIVGFVYSNRFVAYPTLVENLEHNLGADREVFTFVTGLGTALSLSGSAISCGVSTLFVAQAYGLDLSIYLKVIIVLLITVSTLKMDGIMEGGLMLLSVILAYVMKIPEEGYTLILGATSILYQIENVVNVTGNATVAYIISSSEEAVSDVSVRDFL